MKIGILGAGMAGRAFAAAALKHGHDLMLSNSRTPDTLFTLRAVLNCNTGTPEEAAEFGDIVLVAIPLKNYAMVPIMPLRGKIVIDANNYHPERDGHIAELDTDESACELMQLWKNQTQNTPRARSWGATPSRHHDHPCRSQSFAVPSIVPSFAHSHGVLSASPSS